MKDKIIQIVGPTASGKTAFSVLLAPLCDAEIINVDSMQVYQDLAVGSDKPSPTERQSATFHGLDLIPIGPPMDAARFAQYAEQCITDIVARAKLPMLCGGTGLYHRAICHGMLQAPSRDDAFRAKLRQERRTLGQEALFARLEQIDPIAAAKISPSDWVRIERALEYHALTGLCLSQAQSEHGFAQERYDVLSIGCWRPKEERYEKINARLDLMWHGGLLEETQRLLDARLDPNTLPLKALGYQQAAAYLMGLCSQEEALQLAKRETRRFAKRQMTWFRANKSTHWLRLPLTEAELQTLVHEINRFCAGLEVSWEHLPEIANP